MRIGVISDTHRYIYDINFLLEELGNVDVIIHLGDNVEDVKSIYKYYDGKIINVRGNCDFNLSAPLELVEEIEGKRFLITHGHKYNVKYSLANLRYKALEVEADVVLFGHTHVSQIEFMDNIWFINPGSVSLPRDGGKSIGIITIENGQIKPIIKRIK
ncbi:metallophosphoesterase [Clostridium niameyense]|uniref:Phosphoesterase n=1 Tax=Clostridium niameyense TaxID=1622073 RepID=A0A6M0R9F4_9CLOT|nr:metallophosphoesterase [Clostridium niameyense]NEZ46836.1 metallophosphoesterase [Clostridium niameyense]